mmetsp:Transcript_22297/g.61651  ORF Transcript_22297/g.61651 Transcript_22297/m.61651 type:complete len:263 (-) Transcript_22297:4789-5577(-)
MVLLGPPRRLWGAWVCRPRGQRHTSSCMWTSPLSSVTQAVLWATPARVAAAGRAQLCSHAGLAGAHCPLQRLMARTETEMLLQQRTGMRVQVKGIILPPGGITTAASPRKGFAKRMWQPRSAGKATSWQIRIGSASSLASSGASTASPSSCPRAAGAASCCPSPSPGGTGMARCLTLLARMRRSMRRSGASRQKVICAPAPSSWASTTPSKRRMTPSARSPSSRPYGWTIVRALTSSSEIWMCPAHSTTCPFSFTTLCEPQA